MKQVLIINHFREANEPLNQDRTVLTELTQHWVNSTLKEILEPQNDELTQHSIFWVISGYFEIVGVILVWFGGGYFEIFCLIFMS